ncbi:MAG TPA: antitoxin [Thiothrix sp.]|nr:antitoxin [Thiothrix sp.]
MRDHYDFSKMKGKKNPYTKYLKQPVTIRLDTESIAYFKSLAKENNIPYQTLINLYLRDCAVNHRKLQLQWTDSVV